MKVLGISDHYVAGAAVVEDGRLLAAVNEERLVRRKMVMGFPRRSIAEVLRLAGLEAGEIDAVAVASRWGHFLDELVDLDAGVFGVDEGAVKKLFFGLGSRLSFLRARFPLLERLYYDLRQPVYRRRQQRIRQALAQEFGIRAPVDFVWHHRAHAAAAYHASGFEDALVLTLDGSGDGHSSHVYDVVDGRWQLLHSVPSFDGLGNYYGYVTHLCGFTTGKHEGKITGLAAYGKPIHRDLLERFIRFENGSMVNAGNAFRASALRKLRAALPTGWSREDLAASIQSLSEDIAARYVAHWLERSGRRRVALAGGVLANVKINQRIHEIPGVEAIFVCPAMSDEGLGAGAALALSEERGVARPEGGRCFENVYLGPDFEEAEMRQALEAAGLRYDRPIELEAKLAELLAQGYVVARMNGPMEYGPRALGNRSILYRPDDPAVNDWLNERLRRTEFMPFAPATLDEDAEACFDGLDGARDAARFMTVTFDCSEAMQRSCPGVVHIDGTARPQLVRECDNPSYHRILREFKRITGLGTLVNTSFNVHEEPIVCTPRDAVRAFQLGHLDVLALGPFLVKAKDADERVRRAAAARSA